MENIKEKIENKIIDHINSGTQGRLVIFKPENNEFNADLSVSKRGDYKGKPVYLKILVFPEADQEGGFKPYESFYLLFVDFNEITQKIGDNMWLIPSLKFAGGDDIKNKYVQYMIKTKDLGRLMLDAFKKKQ